MYRDVRRTDETSGVSGDLYAQNTVGCSGDAPPETGCLLHTQIAESSVSCSKVLIRFLGAPAATMLRNITPCEDSQEYV